MIDPWDWMVKERQQTILDWAERRQLLKQASLDCKPCRRMVQWVTERMSAFNIRIAKGRRTAQSGDTVPSISTHL